MTTERWQRLRPQATPIFAVPILFGLLASTAFAQAPEPVQPPAQAAVGVKLPVCCQRMIAGSWQAVFGNSFLGVTLVCSLNISSAGVISNSLCNIGTYPFGSQTVTQPPSGTLTIDRACHVTGSIDYIVCSGSPCGNPGASTTVQNQASLWRSRDGTRLSGFPQWNPPNPPPQNIVQFFPLHLIAGQ
jgi:hypothetical protein